jgi:hypothetical protein
MGIEKERVKRRQAEQAKQTQPQAAICSASLKIEVQGQDVLEQEGAGRKTNGLRAACHGA